MGGDQPVPCLTFYICMDKCCFEFGDEVGESPKVVFKVSLMIVDAQVFADPCFMKERPNAIRDSSVLYISLLTWR